MVQKIYMWDSYASKEQTKSMTITPSPPFRYNILHCWITELLLCLQMWLPTDITDHAVSAADF